MKASLRGHGERGSVPKISTCACAADTQGDKMRRVKRSSFSQSTLSSSSSSFSCLSSAVAAVVAGAVPGAEKESRDTGSKEQTRSQTERPDYKEAHFREEKEERSSFNRFHHLLFPLRILPFEGKKDEKVCKRGERAEHLFVVHLLLSPGVRGVCVCFVCSSLSLISLSNKRPYNVVVNRFRD